MLPFLASVIAEGRESLVLLGVWSRSAWKPFHVEGSPPGKNKVNGLLQLVGFLLSTDLCFGYGASTYVY